MVLLVNEDLIPNTLKALNRWGVWKTEKTADGIEKKVSYSTSIRHVNVKKSKTWLSYQSALKLLKKNPEFEGLSFVLTSDLGIVGVDVDDAIIESGELDNTKLEELKALGSYIELSPSGQGFRVFCIAKIPNDKGRKNKKDDIEIYSNGKILSVTGHHIEGTPLTLEPAQEPINAFYEKYFPFQANAIDDSILPRTEVILSDKEIIQLLENGPYKDQFIKLFYHGDLSTSNNDHSSADWSLCRMFVYYTQDPEQVDRLFRKSNLIRSKWDEIHGEGTYGEITINKCLLARKKVYMGGPYIGKSLLTYEHPYKVTDEGIYEIKKIKLFDELVDTLQEICSTPCTLTAVGRNLDNSELLYKLLLKDPEDVEKEIWKDPTELLQKKGVLQLQKEGLLFTESNAGNLTDFFKTMIQRKIKTLPKEHVASKNGWKKDFSLFVVGNRAISAGKETPVLQRDNPTAEFYTENGDLPSWIKAAKELLKYPPVRFKMYSACVPPLLKLLNLPSFVETQQFKSGTLKSTMGLLAASIWGNPERLQLNAESTPAGIQKTVEFCTDLPIFVDETSITDRIKDLVYLIANGVGRSKSNSEGGLVMPSTWSSVVLTTGEKPILPESALMGQQVRVVPLRDGVKEKLPSELVNYVQTTIKTNYGHVGVLFLQELFNEKDNLTNLYNAFFESFPEVDRDDITSDRAKAYYAAIALAGYLLEKVFEKLGIDIEDPYTICEHYFTENVISNSFVPDHIKALGSAYSWFSANEVYFQEEDPEHPLNHERYGWIREDKEHGECVCFIPDKLKKHLNTEIGPNTYEAVTDEWKALNILIPKLQRNLETGAISRLKNNQISTPGGKKPVIKIPMDKFIEYLKLEDENKIKADDIENPENNNKPHALTTQQAANNIKSPSPGAKVVKSIADFEDITGITAQANTITDITAESITESITESTSDNITIVKDDTELAEILKQEGFL